MENKSIRTDYTEQIIALLRGNNAPKALVARLEDYHANDIADAITALTQRERRRFFRACAPDMLSEILEFAETDDAGGYLAEMDIQKAADVIARLDTDTAVDILRELNRDKRTLIIETVDPDVRTELKLIASFDEDEIGSRMTTNCIRLHEGMTIKQSMNEMVRQAQENDNITTLFVVDEAQMFIGAIDLKDLITARSDVSLDDLITTSFPYVYAQELTADCIERLKDYSEDLIPVLDNGNHRNGSCCSQMPLR